MVSACEQRGGRHSLVCNTDIMTYGLDCFKAKKYRSFIVCLAFGYLHYWPTSEISGFSSKPPQESKHCIYTINCGTALYLKMFIPYLQNTLVLKNANHHLSFQQAVIFLLVEGLALILWLLTDWVGGC